LNADHRIIVNELRQKPVQAIHGGGMGISYLPFSYDLPSYEFDRLIFPEDPMLDHLVVLLDSKQVSQPGN
jgi:hypothetical protein